MQSNFKEKILFYKNQKKKIIYVLIGDFTDNWHMDVGLGAPISIECQKFTHHFHAKNIEATAVESW